MVKEIEQNQRQTYNATEVAEILGLCKVKVYQAARDKQLPCLWFGRRVVFPKGPIDRMAAGEAV